MHTRLAVLCLLIAWPIAHAQPVGEATEAIAQTLKAYGEAFNKGDADALAKMWAESATHIDLDTGSQATGRESIQADLKAHFAERPNTKLTTQARQIRLIKPDIAHVHATVTLADPAGPTSFDVSMILVKSGANWLIELAEEREILPPSDPVSALTELEWMIGSWADQSEEVQVQTQVRWSPNGAFLIRSFSYESGEESRKGSQVIGWDPRAQQIRSWAFYSDGSFGEGWWSKSGDEWLVKSTQTLADGSVASGTYVMKPEGDDAMTVQLIGHSVNGEMLPNKPAVRVVRIAEPAASEEVSQ